ncbi:MAG: DUF2889 domain-containing protein [Pseudomonadales bacterium]
MAKDIPFKFYPPSNPDFGSGCYRRRLRLIAQDGLLTGELEDCNHAFKVSIEHDENLITAVFGEAIRHPLSTCPGALSKLQSFVGLRLDNSIADFFQTINARQNCTHLYDLTLSTIGHYQRVLSEPELAQVIIDITIPDAVDGKSDASYQLNGKEILRWSIKNWKIEAPGELQGKPLRRGFIGWVSEHYADNYDLLEAALQTQKGHLVSVAREYDMNALAGTQPGKLYDATGVCHAHQPDIFHQAVQLNTQRDFTDTPEQLLRFIPEIPDL